MLKKYLKNTSLWIKISHSDLYTKFKNPAAFKEQQEEYAFYKSILQDIGFPNTLIMDVGANIGSKSHLFSRLSKKVLAFEPFPKFYALLRHRFENSNVEVINCALGKTDSTLDFYEVKGLEAYNSLSKKHIETVVPKKNNLDTGHSINTIKVPVKKIEHFIQQYGTPVFIKIDVEGYEYEVIQGLETPVPLISFESNLPEFCEESVQIINYLAGISSGKYKFNFTAENSFLLENFVGNEAAVEFLRSTSHGYLEVYCRLFD